MKYRVQRADPAGNITLFVLDEVEKAHRAPLAVRLIRDFPQWKLDQVAFCSAQVPEGADGRMEMMGGEFCGNATRSYAMLLARQQPQRKQQTFRLSVSGSEELILAQVDLEKQTASAQMPLPRSVRAVTVEGVEAVLVDLVGIAHLIVRNVEPSEEFFRRVEPVFARIPDLDAYGVMFLRSDSSLKPLVKVVETGTLIWEGSCGSGTLACAIAQSEGMTGCMFARDYVQPLGVVSAGVKRDESGAVVETRIGGPVTLEAPVVVELD